MQIEINSINCYHASTRKYHLLALFREPVVSILQFSKQPSQHYWHFTTFIKLFCVNACFHLHHGCCLGALWLVFLFFLHVAIPPHFLSYIFVLRVCVSFAFKYTFCLKFSDFVTVFLIFHVFTKFHSSAWSIVMQLHGQFHYQPSIGW